MIIETTKKDWQIIAESLARKNELLKAELNMLKEKRGIYNGVEMQLALMSLILPLTK